MFLVKRHSLFWYNLYVSLKSDTIICPVSARDSPLLFVPDEGYIFRESYELVVYKLRIFI